MRVGAVEGAVSQADELVTHHAVDVAREASDDTQVALGLGGALGQQAARGAIAQLQGVVEGRQHLERGRGVDVGQ